MKATRNNNYPSIQQNKPDLEVKNYIIMKIIIKGKVIPAHN
jgi:hypothetical protein